MNWHSVQIMWTQNSLYNKGRKNHNELLAKRCVYVDKFFARSLPELQTLAGLSDGPDRSLPALLLLLFSCWSTRLHGDTKKINPFVLVSTKRQKEQKHRTERQSETNDEVLVIHYPVSSWPRIWRRTPPTRP